MSYCRFCTSGTPPEGWAKPIGQRSLDLAPLSRPSPIFKKPNKPNLGFKPILHNHLCPWWPTLWVGLAGISTRRRRSRRRAGAVRPNRPPPVGYPTALLWVTSTLHYLQKKTKQTQFRLQTNIPQSLMPMGWPTLWVGLAGIPTRRRRSRRRAGAGRQTALRRWGTPQLCCG